MLDDFDNAFMFFSAATVIFALDSGSRFQKC